jgi:hypothetical protein
MGKEVIKPEKRLGPTTVAAFCIPICLFWFGWTGRTAAIHWIVPIIGSGFFGIGSFLLFQTIFAYLTDVSALCLFARCLSFIVWRLTRFPSCYRPTLPTLLRSSPVTISCDRPLVLDVSPLYLFPPFLFFSSPSLLPSLSSPLLFCSSRYRN